ncbi:2-amino-3-ketobutyrate CoA ligase [Palaeococcus pacificus DY20341]|uniref:8-amino-7-ketopelargonate synthase n=1 Tax=Palaeococcus pacificus DY20341 TaxID=1343739 RepID=A0A075LSJ2_9EURY|nr:glycine C-acetyltransferase [Palaeococcus pacificus]AIF68937.1 2-amino-3-ketobutyrate CoA ligase [Palaeococcus pacificus DY20341]
MAKLDWITEELKELKEKGLYVTIRKLESAQGPWVVVDGKKVLNMCSNNYLGLAAHPKIKEAAIRAILDYGVGAGAVRTIAGTMELHVELEEKLAKFKKREAAILFQSGYNANLGAISALIKKNEDAVFVSEELNHASIIDGMRLSGAPKVIYKHLDMEDLKKRLEEVKDKKKKLIVTDGVFSMDGDLAPLPEIAELAEQYDAMVYVDDAHGEGVLGEHGRGIVDHFKLHDRIDFEMGTLSKAFGVIGGYVAGPEEAIDYLRQRGRPFLFSSAVNPPDVAAAIAAVEILQKSDELVQKLWDNTRFLQNSLRELGYDLGNTKHPITPVMLYDEKRAQEFSRILYEEYNIFAQAIVYPTVPKGTARIRLEPSAAHSKEDLQYAIDAFEEIGKKMKFI